jgi:flagellar hook-associated protein 2
MATTPSIGGVSGGSQVDVQGLAQQLVAADRAPFDAQLANQSSNVTTQISAVGTLMGSLSGFRSSLSSLKSPDAFAVRTATSGDTDIFTATAASTAAAGTYQIQVQNLASAQQISSGEFATATTAVGTGTLTLSVGGKSFDVSVSSSNNTLAGIRDSINKAAGNTGVNATIVTATDGAHLVLSSTATGVANQITVAQSGGDGGLAQLAYSGSAPGKYIQLAPGQDALIKIASYQVTSASNVINNAIDGVTLNLVDAEPDTKISLTVTTDATTAANRIKTFVTAYNALRGQLTTLGGYSSTTQKGGAMMGDSLLTGIDDQLRRTLSAPVAAGGQYQTLASLGITTAADGTLTVDDSKLQSALTTNFDGVSQLFGSSGGVAAHLYTQVDQRLAANAGLQSRSDTLVQEQKNIAQRQSDLNDRMDVLLKSYVQQFTSLDTLLSSLSTTSSFLTQQIDSLGNLGRAIAK